MSSSRVGRSEIHQLRERLSERDLAITQFVERHRFATTTQLRRVFFTEHATQSAATRACTRVLDRLLTLRILTRLERQVGGSLRGSAAFIWCLDVVGDRLTRPAGGTRRRFYEPSYLFLTHTLAITETHVLLREAAATGAFRITRVEVEPESWRPFIGPLGAKSVLKPDLTIALSTDTYEDHWYIEIDQATESLPVLIRKCRAYDEYRRTGRAQAEHGVFPRVLWVMSTSARLARLTAALAADHRLPQRLFTATTPEQVIPTLRDPPP